jgi:hypothetical protein
MNDDALADRRRASEDDYFRKRDNQLIEEARRRAKRDAARQRMSERVGTADDALLRNLEALGLSEETVPLIHVVPLVHIAWSEGTVSPRVPQRIIEVAREHGIKESSEADRHLGDWLRNKPPVALFDGALLAIRTVLQQTTATERDRYTQKLLERCTAIAAASGGCSGLARSQAANVRCWITFAMCWNRRHKSATTRLRKRCRPLARDDRCRTFDYGIRTGWRDR